MCRVSEILPQNFFKKFYFYFLQKKSEKNLMVASNQDYVFHIVFIVTDKNRTVNEEFDFFFIGRGGERSGAPSF